MKPLPHVMILASAGSGKTFALTNRYIELLARGAAPERIVALTFTRKAAGEFFDEILNKLARAASDAGVAAQLAPDVGAAGLGPADFRRWLRAMVDAMHRLQLGTLDAFFARVVRAFPFELGLSGDFEILEEHAARIERERVLRRLFTRAGELDAAQKEFIEAFKRATFGAEEKQLGPRLDAFLDEHQEHFLAGRDAACWGDRQRIWPEGNPWLDTPVDRAGAERALTAWLESAPIAEKQRERWRTFLAAIGGWEPGMEPVRELAYVLEKALDHWAPLVAGRAVIEFDRKKQPLSAPACAALADLTRHVIGGELLRRLATTRGIHAVLRGYDLVYHDVVRRAGKLTFGDLQRLLMPEGEIGALSRAVAADGRLFIDYRLDAEIDHWLLDEFQDTSYGQWGVLRNLIDEVVQDATGRRSFFCVGDVKQAIFTWREGDPRLFREIFSHYNAAAPDAIAERHLDASWRSGPPVVDMVNAVFGAAPVIGGLFPGDAAGTWNREWRPHVSAVPTRTGQAALLLARNERERWWRVIELLRELRPLERGLTCAVLVPKNATAAALADFIRQEGGLPALAESDLQVCTDNPVGTALLALAQAAAHPGDTLAWEHVQMTPLRAVLQDEEVRAPEDLTLRLLAQVHADGFERTMEFWSRKLEARAAYDDAFSRTRARQFAAAAARFDQTGSRDVAEFVQFMERHVVREPEGAAVVRVMTIHKSKGLGFDIVILPELEGKRIDQRREGLAVQKASDRTIEWILDLPPKPFFTADEVLARHVAGAEADACYEALSLLYVAVTRAKRAVYAIIQPAESSTSRNYPKLLTETLGTGTGKVRVGGLTLPGAWSSGDPDWIQSIAAPPEAPAPAPSPKFLGSLTVKSHSILRALRPSAAPLHRLPATKVFQLEAATPAEFGRELHEFLAEVEWAPASLPAKSGETPAVAEAIECLRAPALADVWRRPARADVWRERAFEVVLDDAWVSGVFDRVVVERDAAGRATAVTVYDFKTDRVPDEPAVRDSVRRHTPQLDIYRRVAARLAAVPLERVTCEIVFTHRQRRERVPLAKSALQLTLPFAL